MVQSGVDYDRHAKTPHALGYIPRKASVGLVQTPESLDGQILSFGAKGLGEVSFFLASKPLQKCFFVEGNRNRQPATRRADRLRLRLEPFCERGQAARPLTGVKDAVQSP